jgi:biotin carboxyl carrier protein
MPGTIVSIAVQPGDQVEVGQDLCVLDAMKMNNRIRAPRAGTIAQVHVTVGQQVSYGQPLVTFENGGE